MQHEGRLVPLQSVARARFCACPRQLRDGGWWPHERRRRGKIHHDEVRQDRRSRQYVASRANGSGVESGERGRGFMVDPSQPWRWLSVPTLPRQRAVDGRVLLQDPAPIRFDSTNLDVERLIVAAVSQGGRGVEDQRNVCLRGDSPRGIDVGA